MTITQTELKQLLSYDPLTGLFTYLKSVPRRKKGSLAGTRTPGGDYLNIAIKRKAYKAHRLAWLYMFGEFPEDVLDHIDRDRQNNRIANLRCCSASENQWNRSISSDSPFGFNGVSKACSKNGFVAKIRVADKLIHIGTYATIEDAADARQLAERQYYGEFSPSASDTRQITLPENLRQPNQFN